MSGRFKVDENLPRDVGVWLSDAGHDVHTVVDEGLGGRADPVILDACRTEDRVLVTLDLDFADIGRYPPAGHAGVWLLRGSSQTLRSIIPLLQGALALANTEAPRQAPWIVEHGRLRIRR